MELIIVCALVGIVGSGLYALVPLYRAYCFRTEVAHVYGLFRELQLEAMALGADLRVELLCDRGTWVVRSVSDEAVLPSQRLKLSHVREVRWPDRRGSHVTFLIGPQGWVHPAVKVQFLGPGEAKVIDLSSQLYIRAV